MPSLVATPSMETPGFWTHAGSLAELECSCIAMRMTAFSRRLLAWYGKHARELPWRQASNPYATLVSEVMLQQTRVETARTYFQRWMRRYPTIQRLAAASEEDVLRSWEGLGYYARARRLLATARIVCRDHGGVVPQDVHVLCRLPGIGHYTAGAIASIAHGADEIAIDGNVRRVLARVFDVAARVDSPAAERRFRLLAGGQLPVGRAAEFNEALMDLGATVCLPVSPDCARCPLARFCKSRASGNQLRRPLRRRKRSVPHLVGAAAVIARRGCVLLAKRPADGLLGGLWHFPQAIVKDSPPTSLAAALKAGYQLTVTGPRALTVVNHAYSHFRVTVHAFSCRLAAVDAAHGLKWVAWRDLPKYPMGKVDRTIAVAARSLLSP